MNLEFRELDLKELPTAYPIVRELRTELESAEFEKLYVAANRADSYRLVGAFENGECIGVIGFRVLHDLVHGRHFYIDDLVVSQEHRSRGIGAKLLQYAEETAARADCRKLRLSTGIENEAAKRFYEREGWNLRSVTFKKQLDT